MPFWTDQQLFGDLIKSVVFEQNLLGPKDYDKQRIAALKKSVSIFSAVDNDLFFTVFRRSASEYLLAKDLVKHLPPPHLRRHIKRLPLLLVQHRQLIKHLVLLLL